MAAPSTSRPVDPSEKRSRRVLAACVRALDGVATGRPLAAALSEAFDQDSSIGPQEKRAAARAARDVVRELRRLDLALAIATEKIGFDQRKLSPLDRTLTRYLALRVCLDREPAARSLGELKLPFALRSFTHGDRVLERLAAALPPLDALPLPDDPLRAMALRRSVPDHLARRLSDELGLERADAVLAGLNAPARWDLRVNTLKTTRDELLARLAQEGVQASASALSPDGVVAADRKNLFGAAHSEGLFELQDEGSQLIALACGARAGETAVDFCAGSGGKALALAVQVGREGKVIACDAVPGRLSGLRERVKRAGAQGIVEDQGVEPAAGVQADVVLVDAPCSGVGAMRREIDARWRVTTKVLEELPPKQLAILARAAAFVKKGGRLVYATCSPLRAEDEGVVEAFLAAHPTFARLDVATLLPPSAQAAVEEGVLRTWPDRHDCGAFFAAALIRR